MAAIKNARDKILQAAAVRLLPVFLPPNVTVPSTQVDGLPEIINNSKAIYLRPDSQVFQIAKSGTVSPATIKFTPELRNVTGTQVWEVTAGTATLTDGTGEDAGKKILTFANMGTDTVTVKMTITMNDVEYFDYVTIAKLREGSDTINALLSNESHTLPADSSGLVSTYSGAGTTLKIYIGTVDTTAQWAISKADSLGVTSTLASNAVSLTAFSTSYDAGYVDITATRTGYPTITKRFTLSKSKAGVMGLSTGLMYAYQRKSTVPTLKPGAVTYDFSDAAITVPATDALANGWTKTIPAGTDPLYVCVASASASATTDAIADNEWSDPFLFSQNGMNAATVFIYKRSNGSIPALPTAAATYTFATKALTGLDNGWVTSVPDASNGDHLWVSTASAAATSATDSIPAGEWAAVQLLAKDGVNGVAGVSNALIYAYQRKSTAPTLKPGAVTYTFSSKSITVPATDALANGWTKTIPAGTNPLYVCIASASGQDATDTIADAEWTTPALLAENGDNGLDGFNTATIYIFQRTATNVAPGKPSAQCTYTFATKTLSGLTGSWVTTIPAAGGDYLWVSTATAVSTAGSDDIPATEWATVQLMAKNGSDGIGTQGPRGPGHFYTSGTSWSDPTADAATPGGNVAEDRVTISSGTYVMTKYWNGSSWVADGTVINGNLIVDDSVTAAKVNTNGLTIRDTFGNVIFSSTVALDWSRVAGSGRPENNATYNIGAFADLDQITAINAASYFAANSIDGTFIANLAADKILSGGIDVARYIQSASYSAGSTGWRIHGNGDSEFNNVTVRGAYSSAASGTRITLNEGGNNKLIAYSGSNPVVTVGGASSGLVYSEAGSSGISAIYGSSNTDLWYVGGTAGVCSGGGYGTWGSSGSGIGVRATSGSGPALKANSTTGAAIEVAEGATGINQTGGGSNWLRTINPASDNAYSLGTSGSLRWTAVYATSSTITTSDERTKNIIGPSNLGLGFINSLNPVMYTQKVAENIVTDNWVEVEPAYKGEDESGNYVEIPARTENRPITTQRVGTRVHYGLPAQHVRQTLIDHGAPDAAIWSMADKNDPESLQALRYEELIAPMIKAMQEMTARIVELETRLQQMGV